MHDDLGLSARHLTISTVGITPGIRRMAAESLPVNLAVSLHAANDAPPRRAGPDQSALPARGGRGRVRRLDRGAQPASVVRMGIDRRRQRPSLGRDRAGRDRSPAPRPREPDPVEPDAGMADTRHASGTRVGLPRSATGPRRQRDSSRQPGHRDRRGVRAARRRRQPTCDARPAQYGARSSRLRSLPEPVRGSSSMNDTLRGTL